MRLILEFQAKRPQFTLMQTVGEPAVKNLNSFVVMNVWNAQKVLRPVMCLHWKNTVTTLLKLRIQNVLVPIY